jgi:hypothetical protein
MCRGLIVVVTSLMLLGCEHFEPCENFAAVSSGMSREQVTELVGAPLARYEKDDQEAWEYCVDGWLVDDYVVVWFDGSESAGTLVEFDTDAGPCSSPSGRFSWDLKPDA